VILRKIITSKAAFVSEGCQFFLTMKQTLLDFICFLFYHTGIFTLDRVGATAFLTTDTVALHP